MEQQATVQTDRIERPIGAKLIIIITILLLLSLGAITVLVSVMVTGDVRLTAEDNNYSVNKRSEQDAEIFFGMIRGNTMVILDTMNALGATSAAAGLASDFFFERNQEIAFIGILRHNYGRFSMIRSLANEKFFYSNELDFETITDFLGEYSDILERCTYGETLFVNAAPFFGLPVLAMFYPWHEAGEQDAAVILFSSNVLTENYAEGTNLSYMINDAGDYIIHPNFEFILEGTKAESAFILEALQSTDQVMQTLFTDTDGKRYFGAYRKISL